MVRLPNFFLAGVPKSGTTSLYAYLRQHPQVYMSPVKEPMFFAAPDLLTGPRRAQVLSRATRDRGALRTYLETSHANGPLPLVLDWDDYLELFRNVRDEAAVGEASVGYFWLPSAAPAIRSHVPNARLVFLLRDPAARLFSQYLSTLRHDPRRTFRERFLGAQDPRDAWAPALEVGRYATHLGRFFGIFPRDQIRIQLHDDYEREPLAVLRDICEFLGIDPHHHFDVSSRHGESLVPRFPVLHRLRGRLGGTPALRWLPAAARRALRRVYHRRGAEIAMDPEDRRLVVDYYRDEIERTAHLINRDLSAWPV